MVVVVLLLWKVSKNHYVWDEINRTERILFFNFFFVFIFAGDILFVLGDALWSQLQTLCHLVWITQPVAVHLLFAGRLNGSCLYNSWELEALQNSFGE